MNWRKRGAIATLIALSIYVEASEAGLLRTSGRGSLSRDDSQFIWYFGPESLNAAGVTDAAYMNRFSVGVSKSPIDENRGVAAVPGVCIKPLQEREVERIEDEIFDLEGEVFSLDPALDSAEIADLNAEIDRLSAKISNDPCSWEFAQGENLELFGDFSMFFDVAGIDYAVAWDISGNGQSFAFPGDVNADGARTRDGIDFGPGSGVFLDTPAPAGLVPGIYDVSVSVALRGAGGGQPPGEFFLESPSEDFIWDRSCIENPAWVAFRNDPANFVDGDILGEPLPGKVEPPFDVCGWNTYETDSFFGDKVLAPTSFFSIPETLRITAADPVDGDPTRVNAPPVLLNFAVGLFILGVRAGRRGLTRLR